MQTLSYGYKKPEDTDLGSVFWDALAANIERLATHSHNGTNSASIDNQESGVVVTLDSADWVVDGNWKYKLVSFPTGYTHGIANIKYFLGSGTHSGEQFHPKTEKMSSSSMKLYMPYSTDVDVADQFTVPTTITVVFS